MNIKQTDAIAFMFDAYIDKIANPSNEANQCDENRFFGMTWELADVPNMRDDMIAEVEKTDGHANPRFICCHKMNGGLRPYPCFKITSNPTMTILYFVPSNEQVCFIELIRIYHHDKSKEGYSETANLDKKLCWSTERCTVPSDHSKEMLQNLVSAIERKVHDLRHKEEETLSWTDRMGLPELRNVGGVAPEARLTPFQNEEPSTPNKGEDVLTLREGTPASEMLTEKTKESITALNLETKSDGKPIFRNKLEVMAHLFRCAFPNAKIRWIYPSGKTPKTTVCVEVGCRGRVSFSAFDAYERVDIHVFDWPDSCHVARLENAQRIITFDSGWHWEKFAPPSEDMEKLMDEIVKFFKYHAKKYQDLFHQSLFDVIEQKPVAEEKEKPVAEEEKPMEICLNGVAIRFVKYADSDHQYAVFEIGRVSDGELVSLEKAYTRQSRQIPGDPTNGTLQEKLCGMLYAVRLCLYVDNVRNHNEKDMIVKMISEENSNWAVTISYTPGNIRPTLRSIVRNRLDIGYLWFKRYPVDWDAKDDEEKDTLSVDQNKEKAEEKPVEEKQISTVDFSLAAMRVDSIKPMETAAYGKIKCVTVTFGRILETELARLKEFYTQSHRLWWLRSTFKYTVEPVVFPCFNTTFRYHEVTLGFYVKSDSVFDALNEGDMLQAVSISLVEDGINNSNVFLKTFKRQIWNPRQTWVFDRNESKDESEKKDEPLDSVKLRNVAIKIEKVIVTEGSYVRRVVARIGRVNNIELDKLKALYTDKRRSDWILENFRITATPSPAIPYWECLLGFYVTQTSELTADSEGLVYQIASLTITRGKCSAATLYLANGHIDACRHLQLKYGWTFHTEEPEKKEEKQMDKQDSLSIILNDVKVQVLGVHMSACGEERTDVGPFWDNDKKHYRPHYFFKLWISNVDSGDVAEQLRRVAANVSRFKDVSPFNNGYTITVYDESDSLVDGDHVTLTLTGTKGTAATELKACVCNDSESIIYLDSCPKLAEVGKKKADVVFMILHEKYKSVGRPDGTFVADETTKYLAWCDKDETVVLIRNRNNPVTIARIDVDKIMNVSQDDPIHVLVPWGLDTPAKAFVNGIVNHLRANRVKYWVRLNGEVDLTPEQIIQEDGSSIVLKGNVPSISFEIKTLVTEEERIAAHEQFQRDLDRAILRARKQREEESKTNTNKEEKEMTIKDIKEVRFCGRTTVIKWNDGTYTAVKRAEEDSDDRQKAIALCIVKRNMGNKKSYVRALDKLVAKAAKVAAKDAEEAAARAEEEKSPVKWVRDNSGMYWTCQTAGCGHMNDADAKFCIVCGAAKPKMWKCGCGATNAHIAQYCAQCGKLRKDLDTVVTDSFVDGKPVETPKKPAAKKATTKKPAAKKPTTKKS